MINKLLLEMIKYYSGDPKRIQHFIKVHSISKLIGQSENLNQIELYTLEIASIVHDIGIKVAEQKYGSCSGKLQEKEGPDVAKAMLEKLGVEQEIINKVCYLVAHHHTYNNINSIEYQILVEADFLVNIYEDNMSKESIESVLQKIFKTKTGTLLCEQMFLN